MGVTTDMGTLGNWRRTTFFGPKLRAWAASALLILCCSGAMADVRLTQILKTLLVLNPAGEDIGTYCLIQLYTRRTGVRYILDHNERRPLDPKLYVMWPTVVEKGAKYEYGPWHDEESFGPITFGESYGSYRTLVAKRGWAIYLDDTYSDAYDPKRIVMKEGDSEDLIKGLLTGEIDQKSLHDVFKIQDPEREIVVRLTDDDRERLRKCYYSE